MEHRPARLPSFTAGLAATLVFLGAADGLARLLGASTSPLTAVGLLVIRVLPTDLVKLAIALFGGADKLVLILTVGAAGLVIGGLVTLLLRSRPRTALLTLTAAEAAHTLLVALLFGIVEAPEAGWTAAVVLGPLGAGALLLAAFLWVEARAERPLLPLTLFRTRYRNGALAVRFLLVASTMAFFFVTQLMQTSMGLSPLQAGLGFLPLSVVQFVVAMAVPRLERRGASPHMLITGGVALMAVGMAALVLADGEAGYWRALAVPVALIGAGQGFAFGPLTGAAVAGARADEAGAASGAVNAFHQIGGTFGVGALTSVAVGVVGTGAEAAAAAERGSVGFATASVLLAAAAIIAFVCLRQDRRVSQRGDLPV